MTNEDWVKKLLKLCEQKYGQDVPAMRQLRRRLEAIRQSEAKAMQQLVTGTRNAAAGEALAASDATVRNEM
jgi:uncharacterized protein involved in exopolysaccharide biosynthesis